MQKNNIETCNSGLSRADSESRKDARSTGEDGPMTECEDSQEMMGNSIEIPKIVEKLQQSTLKFASMAKNI